MTEATVNVLFVCLGNICRSPTAEGVFRKVVEEAGLAHRVRIDSAGTGAWHIGSAPDPRAQQSARGRGIDLSDLRARQVDFGDFIEFDYVIAMDRSNRIDLSELSAPEHQDKIRLFLEYTEDYSRDEVPDPYYGGDRGFENVLDMIESASIGLLHDIRSRHGL